MDKERSQAINNPMGKHWDFPPLWYCNTILLLIQKYGCTDCVVSSFKLRTSNFYLHGTVWQKNKILTFHSISSSKNPIFSLCMLHFKNFEKVPFIQHFSEKLDSLIIQGPLRSVGYSIIPHSCAVLSGRISVQILW